MLIQTIRCALYFVRLIMPHWSVSLLYLYIWHIYIIRKYWKQLNIYLKYEWKRNKQPMQQIIVKAQYQSSYLLLARHDTNLPLFEQECMRLIVKSRQPFIYSVAHSNALESYIDQAMYDLQGIVFNGL